MIFPPVISMHSSRIFHLFLSPDWGKRRRRKRRQKNLNFLLKSLQYKECHFEIASKQNEISLLIKIKEVLKWSFVLVVLLFLRNNTMIGCHSFPFRLFSGVLTGQSCPKSWYDVGDGLRWAKCVRAFFSLFSEHAKNPGKKDAEREKEGE